MYGAVYAQFYLSAVRKAATMNPKETASVFPAAPIAGAPFGIEVQVDLSANFTPVEKESLRQLYLRDGMIVFRGQKLTMEQQLEACSIFGPVLPDAIDNYLVSNVHEEGLLGSDELLFHNDIPYVPAPYLGGSLHALEVDEGVSPTRFVSGFDCYDRLPEALREKIATLNAIHGRQRAFTRRTRLTDLIPTDNCAVHSVVGRQQETERPYLFVNFAMTTFIIGMSEQDSNSLLEELFGYLYAKDRIYDHHWRNGDFIVWNNLVLQHARKEITEGTRTLQRVTIAKYGYWEQFPVDLPVFEELQANKRPAA